MFTHKPKFARRWNHNIMRWVCIYVEQIFPEILLKTDQSYIHRQKLIQYMKTEHW